MSIKNAELREYEKTLLDILANNLFSAGRQVSLNETDFGALCLEAYSQAVSLIAFHNLSPDNYPDSDFVGMRNTLNKALSNNAKIDFEHVRICRIMDNVGIPCTILKGYASALYYPDPLMRSMGDVDFLVDTDYLEKASEVLNENGYTKADRNHDVHDIFLGKVCRCEMHFQPSGIPSGKVGVKVRKYLSDLSEKSEKKRTELGEITVPSPFHHGLIILLHMCHHLTGDGLGLRHLCDWAVFINALGEDEFLRMFKAVLKDIGLWEFAKTVTYICREYLGCPATEWSADADKDLAEIILIDIIIGGNFGQKKADRSHESLLITNKDNKKSSMLRQFFASANAIVYSNWKAAEKFRFLLPFGWLFFGGRYIIRSLFGKRPKIRPKKVATNAAERIEIYSRLRLFEKSED